MSFEDNHGRVHDDLRVSVTDRCNLRCSYCMPEQPVWFPHEQILSYEEIARLVRIAVKRGVRKVRVTGGEPLVRRDLSQLIRQIAAEPGVEDLSLTTNGMLLPELAGDLAAAGLRRINVSLDTLNRSRFASMTGKDALPRVLRGLEAARSAGLGPIKVNSVILRDANLDEVETLAERARDEGWELRFIEFMPVENGGTWDLSRVVTGAEARQRVEARWSIEPEPAGDPRAPATRYRYADGRGAVGFINSVTEPFCESCGRLRLTADGTFRVCLYDPDETDLKTPLRRGASDDEIAALMLDAVRGKGRGGAIEILEKQAALPLQRTMHQIGG